MSKTVTRTTAARRRTGPVQYSFVATANELYRFLVNEVPESVKRKARKLLQRSRGETPDAYSARLAEIKRRR